MSYGHDPPGPKGYWDHEATQGYIDPRSPPNTAYSQYRTVTHPVQQQYWNQNGQQEFSASQNYSSPNNEYFAPPTHVTQPDFTQPQFISPAQLFQQDLHAASPSQSYQSISTAGLSRGKKTPPPVAPASSTMVPLGSTGIEVDKPMLLISLAEEYFTAAHELAPTVALSMTPANVEAYEGLIATGLGCLDTLLKRVKLVPRVEAKIRLRFAGVLFEETDNAMDAEVALSKGVALCERNHYYDLKYAMQFLLAQFMAKKNPKASSKALDGHIAEAQTYEHFSWVYAFRFLRATHALESGTLTDQHNAVQNLRAVADLANRQADHVIHFAASLMRAMVYMKWTGPDVIENINNAIASAWSHQLNIGSGVPQLIGMAHILDVACSIRKGNHMEMMSKLSQMQEMMDAALKDPTWSTTSDIIAIPINRTPKSSQTVSEDTRAVLGIGEDGRDNLMISFLSKKDAYSINYLLCGMVLQQKNSSDHKGIKYLEEGLRTLTGESNQHSKNPCGLLPDLLIRHQWRGKVLCYFRLYMAFYAASASDWPGVKQNIEHLSAAAITFGVPLTDFLECLTLYLKGVYHQGIGEFDTALNIFDNEKLRVTPIIKSSPVSSLDQLERDVALLAALNSLLILQDRPRLDLDNNVTLIARLEPLCTGHHNKDIETAFNLIVATVSTNPPTPLFKIKNYLRAALGGAQSTANTQFLCITLSVMCSRFFAGVVGPQAEKSALAASAQAKNSGNLLWRSVANGMLAQCYEVQGKNVEAQKVQHEARYFSQKALPGL